MKIVWLSAPAGAGKTRIANMVMAEYGRRPRGLLLYDGDRPTELELAEKLRTGLYAGALITSTEPMPADILGHHLPFEDWPRKRTGDGLDYDARLVAGTIIRLIGT